MRGRTSRAPPHSRSALRTERTPVSDWAMESIFEKLWRLGPAAFVLKAIVAVIVADGLLLGFILLRRTYRKRYFAKRDVHVFEFRRHWDRLISVEIPYETWRHKSFVRRIVAH